MVNIERLNKNLTKKIESLLSTASYQIRDGVLIFSSDGEDMIISHDGSCFLLRFNGATYRLTPRKMENLTTRDDILLLLRGLAATYEKEKAKACTTIYSTHGKTSHGHIYEQINEKEFLVYDGQEFETYEKIKDEDIEINPLDALPYNSYEPEIADENAELSNLLQECYEILSNYIVAKREELIRWTLEVALSYVKELFNALPFEFRGGEGDTGKTRWLKLIAWLGYRGIETTGLNPANLFRYANDHAGVICINDATRALERNPDLLDLVLESYNKGGKILRTVQVDRRWRQESYNVFTMIFVAANHRYQNQLLAQRFLESKAVPARPRKEDLPLNENSEDYKRIQRVRSSLLLWRMKTLYHGLDVQKICQEIREEMPRDYVGRFQEITLPLLCIAKVANWQYDTIKRYVINVLKERRERREKSIERYILDTIAKIKKEEHEHYIFFLPDFFYQFELDYGVFQEREEKSEEKKGDRIETTFGSFSKRTLGKIIKRLLQEESKTVRVDGVVKRVYCIEKDFFDAIYRRYHPDEEEQGGDEVREKQEEQEQRKEDGKESERELLKEKSEEENDDEKISRYNNNIKAISCYTLQQDRNSAQTASVVTKLLLQSGDFHSADKESVTCNKRLPLYYLLYRAISFSPHSISLEELAKKFNVNKESIKPLIKEGIENGILEADEKFTKISKRSISAVESIREYLKGKKKATFGEIITNFKNELAANGFKSIGSQQFLLDAYFARDRDGCYILPERQVLLIKHDCLLEISNNQGLKLQLRYRKNDLATIDEPTIASLLIENDFAEPVEIEKQKGG